MIPSDDGLVLRKGRVKRARRRKIQVATPKFPALRCSRSPSCGYCYQWRNLIHAQTVPRSKLRQMCAHITRILSASLQHVTCSAALTFFFLVFFLDSYLLQNSAGRVVAAICAAPAVVLAAHGLLDGHKATCYPASGFQGDGGEYKMLHGLPQISSCVIFCCCCCRCCCCCFGLWWYWG